MLPKPLKLCFNNGAQVPEPDGWFAVTMNNKDAVVRVFFWLVFGGFFWTQKLGIMHFYSVLFDPFKYKPHIKQCDCVLWRYSDANIYSVLTCGPQL